MDKRLREPRVPGLGRADRVAWAPVELDCAEFAVFEHLKEFCFGQISGLEQLADIEGVEDLAWNIRAYMVNMVRKSPKEKVRGKRRWPKK